jgi:PAS domain S-box-containing protein
MTVYNHIFIVDDDPNLRKTLSDILKFKGYTSTVMSAGQQAIAQLLVEKPAVVLIDLRLEDMSGLAVMETIKQIAPETECIILTGFASQASAIKAINLGAYSYLQKPYNIDQLLVTIQRAIEKREAAVAIDELRRRNELILNAVGEGIFGVDLEGRTTFVNPAAARMLGYSPEELINGRHHDMVHHTRSDGTPYPEHKCPVTATLTHGTPQAVINELFWHKDGTSFPVEYVSTPIVEEGAVTGAVVTFKNVTDRINLEEQYRQAQKMEALGQLTGGVAHDFNNLLTAINGFAELVQVQLSPQDPMRHMVDQILRSGQRAADLVRQLLAFSRKQIIEPQIIDLNNTIASTEKMLRRIIGEDIRLEVVLAVDLWPIKVDPVQIEQVIFNLAVNARDAMSGGGKLRLETRNVVMGSASASQELPPGDYTALFIQDSGVGMSQDIIPHIFEPFFTTKEIGKGTGLGLATVYGIIKQSQGDILVSSREGEGTTFKIYLPSAQEIMTTAHNIYDEARIPSGTETILLVEDDASVRAIFQMVLQELGYHLLEAENGEMALRVAAACTTPIHLLLTDVVMPDMGGKVLAERLVKVRPDLKVLFASGYTDDALSHQGNLPPNVNLIQKPVSLVTLAHKVRTVLDS